MKSGTLAKLGTLVLFALALLGFTLWLSQRGDAPAGPAQSPASSSPSRSSERVGRASPSEAPAAHVPSPPPPEWPTSEAPFARILSRTLAERRALYEAEEAAVVRCMAERGFEYEPNQYNDDAEVDALFPRYQVGNVDIARTIGYGIAENTDVGEVAVQSDPNAARLQDMPSERRDAWFAALRGKDRPPPSLTGERPDPDVGVVSIPSGPAVAWDRNSCLTKAQRELYGSDDEYMRATLETNMAVNEVLQRTETDPEYLAGLERWKQCMSQSGYNYPRPGDAAMDLGRELREDGMALEDLRTKEIAIATADARCVVQAGLNDLRRSVQQRVERDVLARYGDSLTAYERLVKRALRHARPRLSAGAPPP